MTNDFTLFGPAPWPGCIAVLEVLVLVLFRILQVPLSAWNGGRLVNKS